MSKILIITKKNDTHALLVSNALKKKGISSVLWHPSEYIKEQKSTLLLNPNGYISLHIESQLAFELSDISVVWFRRPKYPKVPNDIHPDDRSFIKSENYMHMQSLWFALSKSAVWINPFTSYDRANCKVLQLQEASNIGMTIPETLISNDKNSIIDFISKNETGTVYKTFVPATWKENKNLFSFYTTEVISNDLPDQEVVKLTPGIYQKKLTKLYEIRAVFFENYYVAVKIHNSEELDWRQQSTPHKMSPLKLPYLIERQCLALMKSLGIIFGSFDFVVTPDGDHIFLEVNEMGQFLWIEDVLPELKLLDIFCEFIISKSQSEKTSFLNSVNNFEKRTIA